MRFSDLHIDSQIKARLIESAKSGRIPHAQLFLNSPGNQALALAVAYAQFINCQAPLENDSCGQCKSCKKFEHLTHPDLHFVYPVVKTSKISKPYSKDFLPQWREYFLSTNFHNIQDWLEVLGASDAQPSIYVHEAEEIINILSYKAFEGKYKVMIIWLPEFMNLSTANKLLKILEEPPEQTIFILVSESTEKILPTILSRTQIVKIPPLSFEDIVKALKQEFPKTNIDLIEQAAKISAGNFLTAKKYLLEVSGNKNLPYFELFVKFMRIAYAAKAAEMVDLTEEITKLGKEQQKQFLEYSLHFIHQTFRLNLGLNKNHSFTQKEYDFAIKFKPFITQNNIEKLNFEFSKAINDLERNAFNKLVFLDLQITVTKLLKQK